MSEKLAKDKPISDMLRVLLDMSLGFFKSRILQRVDLDEEHLRKGIETGFIPLESIVRVLNDDDPNNKEQVRTLMLEWVNGPVSELVEDIFKDLIGKSKDENLRVVFSTILGLGVATLKIYSDKDDDNDTQLKALLKEFIESPETHSVVLEHLVRPMLVKAIKDEAWVSYLMELLRAALKGLDTLRATKLEYEQHSL
jgi:hypothetical protein